MKKKPKPPAWGSGRGPAQSSYRIEQIRSWCRHYDPETVLPGGCCKAGMRYMTVGLTIKERPCFNGHFMENPAGRCPQWDRITKNEALAQYRHEEQVIKDFIKGGIIRGKDAA